MFASGTRGGLFEWPSNVAANSRLWCCAPALTGYLCVVLLCCVLCVLHTVLGWRASASLQTFAGTTVDLEASRRISRVAVSHMPAYKRGLMNAFLFATARHGDVAFVDGVWDRDPERGLPMLREIRGTSLAFLDRVQANNGQ